MVEAGENPVQFKEQGNEAFKKGDWKDSIKWYTKAIKAGEHHKELPVFFKNRAAAYLKEEDYEKAQRDCTKSLELAGNDPKALYRRCQAFEALGRFEEAYRDARGVLSAEPSNKAIQVVLQRLHNIVQERARQNAQTSTKVAQMFKLAFDPAIENGKRETAMRNIVVLAREVAGAEIMLKEGVITQIGKLLKVEKNNELITNAIRIVDSICLRSVDRTKKVILELGIPWFLQILDHINEERVNAAQHCLQTVLNSFSGLENKPDSKPNQDLCEEYKKEIDTLLTCLVYSVTDRTITGHARDSIMELLTRNCHYETLNWAERLVEARGLMRLMEVCSELEEYKYESAMNITPSSRTIAAVCLARIYENMYYDAARATFTEQIHEFVKDKLLNPDLESKVRVTVAITSLLLGPLDVGNQIISREGIMQMILVMATTDDLLQQKVACECLIAASSKKDKAKGLLNNGVDILKRLFKSKDEGIRVRALVGLCKLGSSGGLDASIRPFAEGSTTKLAEACRKFLIKPGKDKDIRKFAAEGLSYLTLDAEVKEKLTEDRTAIQALIELARTGDQSTLYGVVTTLVNLVNAYEKEEVNPELMELAKFAKHHIPEEHELDDPDFISKRILILVEEGVTSGLVSLCKTESANSKEMIARVFNALCSQHETRGKIVQQGGAKVLLPLSLEGTENGKRHAAQALSRIGITINPEVAFPGQRHLEVIRPLINQLNPNCTSLENFEALMALCNLASMSETVRKRMIKEQGMSRIEAFLMEEHLMLRRAASQVICNLVLSDEVVQMFEGNNDRVKFLALLCEEEDEETAKAVSGALAMLTSVSEKCCHKIFDAQAWLDIMHTLIANPSPDVQHRGCVIVYNVIKTSEELAQKIFDTDIMQMLMGVTQLNDETRAKAIKVAGDCLAAAEEMRLIEKNKEEMEMMPDVFKEQATLEEIVDDPVE